MEALLHSAASGSTLRALLLKGCAALGSAAGAALGAVPSPAGAAEEGMALPFPTGAAEEGMALGTAVETAGVATDADGPTGDLRAVAGMALYRRCVATGESEHVTRVTKSNRSRRAKAKQRFKEAVTSRINSACSSAFRFWRASV